MMSHVETAIYSCQQSNCPLTTSGLCLEGLAVAECPHAFLTDTEADEETTEMDLPESVDEVSLFSGEELGILQLTDITYAFSSRLVVILGEPNCGKTTILASLFDLFQKGPFGPYWFAGSRTQIGFEKRCHLARFASGRATPDTERTRSNNFSFLHLALRKRPEPIQHLLFTDVSGERYRLARDSAQEMNQLTILGQADLVFCVVDGEQLASTNSRQISKANLIALLNRIQQNSNLPPGKGLYILITKWDIIVEQQQVENVTRIVLTPVQNRFTNLVKEVIPVCARPMVTDQLETGYGFDSVLELCTAVSLQSPKDAPTTLSYPVREFGRFTTRY